jgi:hypothetical protein
MGALRERTVRSHAMWLSGTAPRDGRIPAGV